jgi:hypothetical protein
VPSYLVETYLPRTHLRARAARERRARAAAEELSMSGTNVRFDSWIHVPEDEICFFLFDAPSSRDAALAAERAGMEPVRVTAAVASCRDAPDGERDLTIRRRRS